MDREELIEFIRSLTDEERDEFGELLEYGDWKPEFVGPKQPSNMFVTRGAFHKLFKGSLREEYEQIWKDTYGS